MNEEFKVKLREMLEQYASDLDTMWYNCDSTMCCEMYRKRQAEIAVLLYELA